MILTLLMFSFTLAAHWLACIWYVIAVKEYEWFPDSNIGEYDRIKPKSRSSASSRTAIRVG